MKFLIPTLLCLGMATGPAGALAGESDYQKLYQQGVELNKKGDLDGAIALYSKALALKPDSPPILFVRGRAYRNKGLRDKALDDLNRAISLKPDYGDAYNQRGITYIGLEQKEKALADFTKACSLKNTDGCENIKRFKTMNKNP